MALGFMRRHRKWLFGFLWVVIAAFIILYIPAFQSADARGSAATLVEVGSEPITVGEYQKAYQRQREMYQSLYQGRLDSEGLKRLGLEERTLQGLIDERVVLLEARRLGLHVDDESIRRKVATAPEFQIDGRFMGGEELRRRLEMQGIKVTEFEEDLRRQLVRERLVSLVTDGVMVSPKEAEEEFRRRTEQVKTEYVLVPADLAPITVSDEEVKARFESNKDAYRLPERRVVRYAMADASALQSRVTVTEAEERAYYEAHLDQFKQPEQVCATHILVKVKSTPDAKEGHPEDEAKKLAQAALDAVKGGADFAGVARKSSEDQGSATQGGDLGCFPRGKMVTDFENAAFALDAGQTSGLVHSPYGYHIIRVTSRKEETTAPFTQVKERMQQTLATQRVRGLMEEQVTAVSDALRRGKTLEDTAKAQGLPVATSPPFSRAEPPPLLASAGLAARAFEMKRAETEPDPFSVPGGYAFISLAEIQPSRPAEAKEVQDKVRADLKRERALEKAKTIALDLKTRAEKDGLEKAAAALSLVRKETPGLVGRGQPMGDLGTSAALDRAAYALPEKALSDPIPVASGLAVFRVLEKKAFDPAAFEKEKPQLVTSLREERKQELFRAYMEEARRRFPIQRHVEAYRRVMTS